MDSWDTAEYLTQRLRRLQPESYEEELRKKRKIALRRGFALGVFVALVFLGSGVMAVVGFWPELVLSLVGSLR